MSLWRLCEFIANGTSKLRRCTMCLQTGEPWITVHARLINEEMKFHIYNVYWKYDWW